MLQAHHAAWGTMTWVAKFDAVCEHAETGLALYDPARHQDHAIRYGGHDPGVCGHAQGGLARWFLGYPDKAVSESAQALDLANDLGHGNSILHANTWQGLIALFARDTDKAMELGQRVLGSASDRGLPLYSMIGGVIIGGTQARGAEAAAGRERLAAILANFDAMGLGIFKVMISGFHAESCLRIGDLAEAAKIVETAIATSVASADVFWLPELKRLAGEILSAGDADADSIEASFQAAIETARGHGSRSLELRATTSLAGLWQSQGKHQQAHDTLAPLYDHFTEGFETTDLKDAKALLQELA